MPKSNKPRYDSTARVLSHMRSETPDYVAASFARVGMEPDGNKRRRHLHLMEELPCQRCA